MARNIKLKTFQVSTNGVDLKTGLPNRLKLMDWGENTLNTGEKVRIDQNSANVFASNQKLMGRETVPIDYEHSTVPGTPAYERSKPSDPLAGYGRPVVIPGQGLFLESVETTPHGVINAPNFKDISPTPLVDESGSVVGMHSMALTVAGAVDGLTLSDAAMKALSADLNFKSLSTTTQKEPNAYTNGQTKNYGFEPMDIKFFRDNDPKGELKDMTDEKALDWVKAKWCGMCGKEGTITPNSMNQPPKWDDQWNAKVSELVTGAVTPLNATIQTLTAKLAEKEKSDTETEKQGIIAAAVKEGRVITLTAEQVKEFNPAQLKVMIAQIPKGRIPTGPLTQTITGSASLKPLTAMKPDERDAVLTQNRLRTMDVYTALAGELRRGHSVN